MIKTGEFNYKSNYDTLLNEPSLENTESSKEVTASYARNFFALLFTTTDGLYGVAKLSHIIAGYLPTFKATKCVTPKLHFITDAYMDFCDALGIIDDIQDLTSGDFYKKFQQREFYSLSKKIVSCVAINIPSTLSFLEKIQLVDLGTLALSIGSTSIFGRTPFGFIISIHLASVMQAAGALLKAGQLSEGIFTLLTDEKKERQSQVNIINALASIGSSLAGASAPSLARALSLISAVTGLIRLGYSEKAFSPQYDPEPTFCGKVEGIFNLAKLGENLAADAGFILPMLFSVSLPCLDRFQREMKIVSRFINWRNWAEYYVKNHKKESKKAGLLEQAKYVFTRIGHIRHAFAALEAHGVDILGSIAEKMGKKAAVGVGAFRWICEASFLASASIGLETLCVKMWISPEERTTANTLDVVKELGKVALIIGGNSLGFLSRPASLSYFLVVGTIASIASFSKYKLELKREQEEWNQRNP